MGNYKVTVSVITYNQERYIAKALDSILMQKTDFDYEIVIGEDQSEDNTREIVLAYQKAYPDKIRVLLNDRSQVIYINNRPTGRWNLINNLKHAQGQYVALLEGDDYWTSSDKLQKQVDCLDTHQEYAICFHPVVHLIQGDKTSSTVTPAVEKDFYTLHDLLAGNFISTCSVMFRNGLFDELPYWYYTVPMGDWPLHIINAHYGNIGYLKQAMAVYRIHQGGVWSVRGVSQRIKAKLDTMYILRDVLSKQYRSKLTESIIRSHMQLLRISYQSKNSGLFFRYLGSFLKEMGTPYALPVTLKYLRDKCKL